MKHLLLTAQLPALILRTFRPAGHIKSALSSCRKMINSFVSHIIIMWELIYEMNKAHEDVLNILTPLSVMSNKHPVAVTTFTMHNIVYKCP